jgi:hypothetical protein
MPEGKRIALLEVTHPVYDKAIEALKKVVG